MRLRGSIGALLIVAVGLFGTPAAVADAPSAQRLLDHVDRLGWELGLPLEDPGLLNLRSIDSLSEVRLVNSDGYEIRVVAFGQTAALSVIRRSPKRAATTTYLAHGRVTPTAIVASFAERGRVELHFQRSTGPLGHTPLAGCGAGRPVLRDGLFVGGVRFRGEGGYTSAEAHRARGISIDLDALDACLRHGLRDRGRRGAHRSRSLLGTLLALAASGDRQAPAPPGVPTRPSEKSPPTILFAERKLPLSRTVFGALAGARGQDARYVAAETASEGAIGVIRFVTAKAPSGSFTFDGTLSSARVAPPLPFGGRGLFQHGPGSEKSWTGSLSVSFLGAPHVPLTGTSFGTVLGQEF